MTGRGQSNPRRANGHRRDQVRRRVLAEESECWLCEKPVDKTLGFMPGVHSKRCANPTCSGCVRDPLSPEVDEIVRVTDGGSPFDRANCRLSHRHCNRYRDVAKPAKSMRVPQMATSRAW